MRKTSILDKFKLDEGWFSLAALVLAFMTVVWSIEAAHWHSRFIARLWVGESSVCAWLTGPFFYD